MEIENGRNGNCEGRDYWLLQELEGRSDEYRMFNGETELEVLWTYVSVTTSSWGCVPHGLFPKFSPLPESFL